MQVSQQEQGVGHWGLQSVGAGQVHGGEGEGLAGGDGAVGPHGVYPVSTSGTAGGICVPDQDWDQDGQNLGGQGEQRQAPGLEPVPRLPWPWGWSPIRQYVPASFTCLLCEDQYESVKKINHDNCL